MAIFVPISWGELLDKITILEIKSERLTSPAARSNVLDELARLSNIALALDDHTDRKTEVTNLKAALRRTNETLWDIEDAIRDKEAQGVFDRRFIELARSVYRTNDQRARIKREINLLLQSDLIEEKQYVSY